MAEIISGFECVMLKEVSVSTEEITPITSNECASKFPALLA